MYTCLCSGIPYNWVMNMKKSTKTYVLSIVLAEGVGALSGFLSRSGMDVYSDTVRQPPLSPPMLLFPVVWSVLYALMGISSARIYLSAPSKERSLGLNIYIAQLVVNFFWSLIFFNAQAFGFALVWLLILWALVLWMILVFWKTDPLAAKLQIPYLLWLAFAVYLNAAVWYLNP